MADDWSEPAEAVGEDQLLSEARLAHRWQKSPRSLQRWRSNGGGPPYYRIGHAIRYRLSDVLAFEAAARHGGRASQ